MLRRSSVPYLGKVPKVPTTVLPYLPTYLPYLPRLTYHTYRTAPYRTDHTVLYPNSSLPVSPSPLQHPAPPSPGRGTSAPDLTGQGRRYAGRGDWFWLQIPPQRSACPPSARRRSGWLHCSCHSKKRLSTPVKNAMSLCTQCLPPGVQSQSVKRSSIRRTHHGLMRRTALEGMLSVCTLRPDNHVPHFIYTAAKSGLLLRLYYRSSWQASGFDTALGKLPAAEACPTLLWSAGMFPIM